MAEVKVLIVDDSATVQDLLKDIFSSDHDLRVVGTASNGLEAVERAKTLQPDIITMDINMPVMNGLEAIERIMANNPRPIMVVTDLDHSKVAFAALSKGALDVQQKSFLTMGQGADFIAKVKLLAKVKVIRHLQLKKDRGVAAVLAPLAPPAPPVAPVPVAEKQVRAVAIASSTGGPKALSQIFSDLDGGFPVPILVAQHMDDGFIAGLVEWLDGVSSLNVKLAQTGEMLRANTAYFAPAGFHLAVSPTRRVSLVERAREDIFHPSCNRLLQSAGDAYGAGCAGVILTGMGDDGVEGLRRIHERGGMTIAQDEATSSVFGMPNVAINSGCVDRVLPLGDIGGALRHLATPN
ncbi:MAG: chemotaxis-specific protein-glutamate methyltransferase CheB [Nitrospinae bacterium]|nr:chemotaxis-specific protein-glutamate methyltransferase CheB [Nitrospinota bacterium]